MERAFTRASLAEVEEVRREFARRYRAAGHSLVSVGIGSDQSGPFLHVLVNKSVPAVRLPRQFHGVRVMTQARNRAVLAVGSAT